MPKVPVEVENPCMPSPCGGNSQCRVVDHRPVCSCLPGMLGAPPNCRPECLIHADCPNRLACIGSKCKDPCVGSCGFNALCNVVNHQPVCSCQQGYHGDPFSGCSLGKLSYSLWNTFLGYLNGNWKFVYQLFMFFVITHKV